MLIAIVAHHSRRAMANDLASELEADSIFMDEHSAGANANHLRALSWAAEQSDRVIIIEEDALPVDGFRDKAQDWLTRFPDDLCSFYLGTGRPPQYQMQIAERLIVADKTRADYITLSRLIHGVCYSVPPEHVQRVLSRWDNQQLKGSGIKLRHHTDSIKLVGHPFKPVFPLLVEMLRRWGYP